MRLHALLAVMLAAPLLAGAVSADHVPSGEIRWACGGGGGHPDDCGIDPVGGGAAVGSTGTPEHGDAWIGGDEEVLGVVVQGEARAYPLKMMSRHEIANDVIAGVPVAVTYCPLCGSGLTFDRRATVDGQNFTLTFTASGYLWKADLVMWDPQTETLWNQILGEPIGSLDGSQVRGEHPDAKLEVYSTSIVTWSTWKERHPSSPMLQPVFESYRDPYEGYYESCRIGVSGTPDCDVRGLHPKARIVGVTLDGEAAAYVVEAVQKAGGVVVDQLADRTIVVHVADGGASTVYDAGDRSFTRENGRWVDGDGRAWDLAEGRRADGAEQLAQVDSIVSFWFAWQELHTETTVFTGGDPDAGAPQSTPGFATVAVIGAAAAALALLRRRRR